MRSSLLLLVLLVGCRATAPDTLTPAEATAAEAMAAEAMAAEAEIRAVLDAQVAAWNAGSVRGFMEGYAQTDSLRFASRGTVRTGWDETLAGYERGYPDAAAMGTLAFSELDVRLLSCDWALVFGRWRLDRAADTPNGLFTLTMQRRPEGWRVLYDHTSSAE
ncbi:MAG: nuclear transport factor 2 family protein [Bacteroidota bacterium]